MKKISTSEYYYISLQFFNDFEKSRKIKEKKDPVIMNIFLEKPVQASVFRSIAKSSGQKWTKEVVEFWGPQRIKDITLVNYGF